MKVAIIGGGAAGMGAAWGLTKAGFEVTLIEMEATLGGQCLGAPVPLPDGGTAWVDVGVSDFNRATFTNVAALFDELGLEYRPICQDASFMHPDGRTAWYTNSGEIFPVSGFEDEARLRDEIARFRLQCMEVVEDETFRTMRLADWCDLRDYSHEFRELYLYPRAQGSFPMPDCDPADYQARALIAFWRIHGIAGPGPADRNVLVGGMYAYGEHFAGWLRERGGTVVTGAQVVGVARRPEGVRVRYVEPDGASRTLGADHVVFAVRSNQVIPMIEDASEEEKRVYEGFLWQRARVVVHQDTALMPDRREAWGAYNYVLNEPGGPQIRPTITFYPNKLAGVGDAMPDTFVTMNPFRDPAPDKIIAERFFIHPAAGVSTDLACARIQQMQGVRNTWYCGSYLTRPWVHEQALATGVVLAELMRHRLPGALDADGLPHIDDFLRSIPLFKGLDPFALADVQLAAERFTVPAGGCLFRQNDEADGLHLIARGALRVVARTPGDEEVELARLGAGDMIGEFALLDGGRRSAGAEADEPTSGYFISRRRFETMMRSGRPAAFEVLDRVRAEVARRARTTIASIDMPADPALLRSRAPAGEPRQGGTEGLAETLRTLRPFASLTAAEASTLAALCTRIDAPRGTILAAAGEPPRHMFIVLRGALRATIDRPGGLEQLGIYGPGAMAGLFAMLDGGDEPTTLDVREDALLLAMERRNFEALRAGHSELAFKLFEEIGRQVTRDLRRLSRHAGRAEALSAFNQSRTSPEAANV